MGQLTNAPVRTPITGTDANGAPVSVVVNNQRDWVEFFVNLISYISGISFLVASGALGSEPLNPPDGTEFLVTTSADGLTDYYHQLTFANGKWNFCGDPSGRFGDFMADPGRGWQLCDGTATKRLTVGATLGETAMATPDEKTNLSVHESIAAYTGNILAPVAPAFTGTPATSGNASAGAGGTAGGFVGYASINHTHDTTATGTVDATGKQQRVGVLRYARR